MANLVTACAFFLLINLGVSGTRLRTLLVARLGERPYRGLFASASLVGLAWLIFAYHLAPVRPTWGLLLSLRPAAYVLVFIAFLFAVVGLTTPSATRVGMEARLDPAGVRGVTRITRHPFLWGTALWALTHLVINGDWASLILFSSMFVLALGGTTSIDAKRRRRFGTAWRTYSLATSSVPFAAVARGSQHLRQALREIGAWRFGVAIALYAAAFIIHGALGHPLY
ncbi:MAG: NnrU family protein [Steroidobacteraceae bacterium]